MFLGSSRCLNKSQISKKCVSKIFSNYMLLNVFQTLQEEYESRCCLVHSSKGQPGNPRENPIHPLCSQSLSRPTNFLLLATRASITSPSSLSIFKMPGITKPASALLRSCVRQQLPAIRTSSALIQKRNVETTTTSSFDSPFKGMASTGTDKIPSFGKYKSSSGENQNKVFQYFMVGTFGALASLGAQSTVQGKVN